jgi:hypothetical protein
MLAVHTAAAYVQLGAHSMQHSPDLYTGNSLHKRHSTQSAVSPWPHMVLHMEDTDLPCSAHLSMLISLLSLSHFMAFRAEGFTTAS